MNSPPGPKAPYFVQHYRWFHEPLEFVEECRQRYGDVFQIRLGEGKGHYPLIMINKPEHVQSILTDDFNKFDSGEGHLALQALVGENSLLTMDGTKHALHKNLMKPQFYGEALRGYGTAMRDVTNRHMSKLERGETFSVRNLMQRISMSVISNTVFGLEKGAEHEELENRVASLMNWVASLVGYTSLTYEPFRKEFGGITPWGAFVRERAAIDKIVYRQIERSRQNGGGSTRDSEPKNGRHNVLNLLVQAKDEEGQGMSDQEVRDELMTILVSGHETTASSLTWALYWLHQNPEIKEKLLEELDSCDDPTDPQKLYALPYLTAVCNETLRICPALLIAFVRINREPYRFLDYEFPAHSNITPCIYLTHHRKEIFDNPEEFRPERFLNKQYTAFEYYPFGGSNRRCIGSSYAVYEMKIVIATMLLNWELRAKDRKKFKATRRGITITPPEAFQLVNDGKRADI